MSTRPGYAAAMQAIREIAACPAPDEKRPTPAAPAQRGRPPRQPQPAPRKAQTRQARAALQRDKGVSLAYTSIRDALGQLEARKAVEQDGDGGWPVALEATS